MPFNGSGTFSIVNTFVPNTTILSAAVNANFTDIATGLSDVLTRDGQAGMSAALKLISGSAGAPSLTFNSDATTGLYLISAGNLGIAAAGVLNITVSSGGTTQFAQGASGKLHMVLDTANATTATNINTLATSGTGAIGVASTTNWNTNGYLLCNSEIMSYTVASAAGLTINSRGELGSTSITQATASTLTMLFTTLSKNDIPLPPRATAGRPTHPVPGSFGYNTTLGQPEYYNGTTWISTAAPQLTPQGYLSPTAGTAIITGDATSQATIFYNPYVGNLLPIPTNGVFALTSFTTASIALSASQAVNNIYDVYGFISSTNSTLTFGMSPSWSAGTSGSVTAGACARGSSTGGTALTALNGLYVNTVTTTLLNGASSYSIATASGIYLGTIFVSPTTAGTVNLHKSYGQSRQWGIWNAYNRAPIYLKAGDSTASWSPSGTLGPINQTTANNLTLLCGLAEEPFDLSYSGEFSGTAGATGTMGMRTAIGFNSTATASGFTGQAVNGAASSTFSITASPMGRFQTGPSTTSLGINIVTALEQAVGSAPTAAGGEANSLLVARWRG